MKVFVISINEQRWSKYDPTIYTLFQGCNGKEDLDLDEIKKTHLNLPSCTDEHRYNVAGCLESHRRVLRKIIDEKLNEVIVMEDDALLDETRLKELEGINHFCYIGGRFQPRVLTSNRKKWRETVTPTEGLNRLPYEVTISATHGLYFPTWEIAEQIYQRIFTKRWVRAIDGEYRTLQKKGELIQHFLYPAISTLYIPDAKNGFTFAQKSSQKLTDTYYNY